MSPTTRRIVLGSIAVLLIGGIAAWWFSGFSLEFMRFFAAEETPPFTLTPSPTPTIGADLGIPEIVTCAPLRQTVAVDEPAAVTAAGGGGPYEWFAPNGTINGSGSQITVTYTTVGTKKVTVQTTRANSTEVDSVACTVVVE
jgi:hypothetical protein